MIIGSTAIKFWYPEFNREPKDLDIIYDTEDRKKELIDKYKDLPDKKEFLHNPVMYEYFENTGRAYLTPNELYTLKISHVFWELENNSWEKHMWDIQFLKEKGCVFIPELFWNLFDFWTKKHGKRKASNLDMSAEDFFNNAIKFPVEHDSLHEILIDHPHFKGQKLPTYNLILKDGAEVDVCMDKFNKLSEEQKFNVVFEEVAVMALERYGDLHYKAAFNKMLKKFILLHCKIEEGVWIVQNHKELLTKIPFNYFKYLNEKIEYELKTN